MRESHIQNQISNFLKNNRCLVIKQEPTSILGIPDLLVVYRNRHFWIEVKTKSGKLSRVQKTCHQFLKEEHGQKVFVCRDVKEAEDALCSALKI